MKISSKRIKADGKVTFSVNIKKVGAREGVEIGQLYIHDVVGSVKRPIKELRGFERINLKAGENKTVTITLTGDNLSFYDKKTHQFIVEPGAFEVMVGSSSDSIRLKDQFNVVN